MIRPACPRRRDRRKAIPAALGAALMATLPAGCDARGAPQPAGAQLPAATRPDATQPVVRAADRTLRWQRPRFQERQAERDRLVARHILRPGAFSPRIRDQRVIQALRDVPRHEFVPPEYQASAYRDTPLPIGYGQTISQPYIVALMTDCLALRPGQKVLEIGTGSGYQAAVLAELTPFVFTIEILRPLYRQAAARLARLGYRTIRCRNADGYFGWQEHAPFDAIIVTCAAGHVPPPLWEQLRPGGRMVIPIGDAHAVQRLVVLIKQPGGGRRSRNILPVRFVPMTGKNRQR